jgi:hypothetical protein
MSSASAAPAALQVTPPSRLRKTPVSYVPTYNTSESSGSTISPRWCPTRGGWKWDEHPRGPVVGGRVHAAQRGDVDRPGSVRIGGHELESCSRNNEARIHVAPPSRLTAILS